MTYQDIIKVRKKNKEESQPSKNSAGTLSYNDVLQRRRAITNTETEKQIKEDLQSGDSYVNQWFEKANTAVNRANGYMTNPTYNSQKNLYDNVSSEFADLENSVGVVKSYIEKYGYTDEGAKLQSLYSNLTNAMSYYKEQSKIIQDEMAKFTSEEEYNNALREAKYANYSYDDLQNELNDFDEDSEDYEWLTEKSNEVASSEESQKELEPLQEELDSLEAEYKELLKSSEENPTTSERKKINERLDYIEKTRPTLQKEVEDKKRQVNAKTSEEEENKYNNAMLEKYGDYSYEQLFAEAKKFDDNSNESNWLKNAGYEKATSEDLQSEYDKLTDEYHLLYDSRDEETSYNRLKEIEQIQGDLENQISKKKQEERVAEFNNLDEETRNIISARANINYWSPVTWWAKDDATKEAEENYDNLDMSEEEKSKHLKTYNRIVENYNAELQHKAVQEQAENNPVLASVISVGNNTIGAIPDAFKYIGANIDKANGGDGYVNPRATNVSKAQTARATVSENMGGIGSFLYNTGMSLADFASLLPLNLVPGGQTASLAILGTSSGASAANTVIENGGSLDSAISTGLAAGIAESFFEKFSLGQLKALKAKGTDSVKKAILKNAFVEGSEEVGTDIANAITDQIINGDMSQLSLQYQSYIDQGYTEDEAWKKCAADFGAQVGQSFLGGAISGEVLGGGAIGLNYATNKIGNSKTAINNKVGKAVKENENVNSLIETAKKLSPESKAYKVAAQLEEQQKNNKKVSSSKVGQLRSLIIEQSQTEFDTEYKKATENLHEDEKAVVDKLLNREALSEDEVKILNDNDVLKNSIADVQKKFNNLYSSTETANKAPFKSIKSIDDNTDKINETKLKVSEDGKTKVNDEVYDGAMEVVRTNPFAETVTYKMEKNGEVIEVNSDNIEFRTKEEAKLNALASKYNVQTAQKFFDLYESGQDVDEYSREFNIFQNYGRLAVPLDSEKLNVGYLLNNDQKMGAYEAGLTSRKSYYQEQNIISSNAKNSKYYAYTKGNFNASAIKGIQLDETQRAFYNFFREFALRTGINVELFSSKEISGKYQGEQGSWNKNTKTIRIDINAGLKNVSDRKEIKHGMLNTFSHELTHIAELSGFYDELHEAIVSALEKRGTDFNELVKAKKDELVNSTPNAKVMSDEKLTYLADVEVIAECCETMLKNSKIFEDIAQGNPTLAQKIKDKLKNFIARLKQLLNKTSALTPEGKLLEECVTEFENINRIWDKAVTDGIKTANAIQAEQKNNTAENSDVKNSSRYSYNELINKPDMEITVIDDSTEYTSNAATRKKIVDEAVENAINVGYKNANENAVVKVEDIKTDVIISKSALRHGLDRRLNILAPITLNVGDILQNSIRINEMLPKNPNVEKTYVLIGVAKNQNNEPYIVSFVVNRSTNELTSVDVLYSINTKTEPAGSLSPDVPTKVDYLTGSTISISDLLDYVNKYYPDILSEDVLKHYNYASRPDGKLGESVLYQSRTADIDENIEDLLFDEEFYKPFENEDKTVITESLSELQAKLEDMNDDNSTWEEQFAIRTKIKALKEGYKSPYDYFVGKQKKNILKEYEYNPEKFKEKFREKAEKKVKEESLKNDIANATPHKRAQYYIIQKTNPMWDDYHVGIRSPKDIKTFQEVVDEGEGFEWGDFDLDDAKMALKKGTIRVYSSYAIKNGTFVSTSYQQALEYAGMNPQNVHSRVVALDSVAWINGDEGQYAKVYKSDLDDSKHSDLLFQMRPDNGFANRRLLANALENSAQNNYEKNKVKLYKENIDQIDELEARLDEVNEKIKKATSVKAAERTREQRTELMKLNNVKKILQDKIVRKDKQLLNFESMDVMKKLIESEKRKAKHEARINYEAKLKDEREKHNAELASVKERDRERLSEVIESKDKIIVAEREKRKTMVKGIREARDKKEIIRKTIKKIKDIDKLLNRSKADKTVKQGLRDTASKLLSLKDILLDTNLSNADIVRRGVENATPEEQKLLDEYLSIIGDTDTELSEAQRRKVYQLNSKLKDLFIRERERLNRATVKQALTELSETYKSVENAPEAYLRNSFDKNIIEAIDNFKEEIGGTLVKDMTVKQVQELHDIVTMILTSIRNANKLFAEDMKLTCEETSNDVMNEILNVKGTKEIRNILANKILDFQWRNLKPIYAFRLMGSKTFEKIYWNLQKGELDWYIDLAEAKKFKEECEEKFGYKSFDFKKTFEFTAMDGSTFTLDLNQMMDIYAASRRPQALQHLLKGGFTFEKDSADGNLKVKTGAKAYPLTMGTIQSIANGLSENEKGYAKAMQKYLSEIMAKKGNEVSMALYGVEMFNEDTYWSISSSDTFLKVEENETTGEFKVKNSGFTKSTIRNASNPIVLRGFEENWCNHVNQMSLYHAMTLPLEDFTKVFNYNTGVRTSEENPTAVTGVRSVIKGAFGNSADSYIKQFLSDINGGIREASRVGIADNLISLSKKASVFANLSVFIQQPSAILRALAYVDARYFLPEPNKLIRVQNYRKDWEQLKKYAPIAGIKEMGKFDTGTGKGVLEWLSSGQRDSVVKKTRNKIDDIGSWLPEMADKYAWIKLWHAIQRETRAKYGLKIGTKENLVKSGERFNEVIELTQVYDSVFSRSGAMRSNQTFDKIATSYMAEPTIIMNMTIDAVVQLKRNGKAGVKQFAKTFSSILISIFANTLLKSIVFAGRDDDEDETYSDKYWQAVRDDLVGWGSSLNPLNYYPIMRDIMSVFEGYTTERMDMSLVSDLVISIKRLMKEDGTTTDNITDFIGYIANLFGLPVRNVVRDIKAAFNTYDTLTTASKDPITSLEMSIPTAYQETYDKYWEDGYTADECRKKAITSVKSKISKKLKPVYLEALKNQDSKTVRNIRQYMNNSGFYKSLNDVDDILKGWRENSDEEEKRAQRAEKRK